MPTNPPPNEDQSGNGKNPQTGQTNEFETKYNELMERIQKGELIEPSKIDVSAQIASKVDAGEIFTKAAYNGLQKTVEERTGSLTKANERLTTVQTELDTAKAALATLNDIQTKYDELDLAAKAKDAQLLRAGMIFKEFPALASFEADGLLPDSADEAELRTLLGKFQERLTNLKELQIKNFNAGGSGTPPPENVGTKTQSAAAHLKAAQEAIAKGDYETYNKEYDLYLAESDPAKQ